MNSHQMTQNLFPPHPAGISEEEIKKFCEFLRDSWNEQYEFGDLHAHLVAIDYLEQRIDLFTLQNKITTLNLAACQLLEIPKGISILQNLFFLDLKANELTHLSDELSHLPHLKKLHLEGNRFTEVPPLLKQLKNLSSAYLSHNLISEIPASLYEKIGEPLPLYAIWVDDE